MLRFRFECLFSNGPPERYDDLRAKFCNAKQCTSLKQGNACAAHWNSVGMHGDRLWGCISRAVRRAGSPGFTAFTFNV